MGRAAAAGVIARLKAAGLLALASQKLSSRSDEDRRRGRDAATYQAIIPAIKSTKSNQFDEAIKSTNVDLISNKVHEQVDKSPQNRTPTTRPQQLEDIRESSPYIPQADDAAAVVAVMEPAAGEIIDATGFEVFWRTYPKRISKSAAQSAWAAAIASGEDPAQIIRGAEIYAMSLRAKIDAGEDPRDVLHFTKVAKNWLAEKRWTDIPAPPRPRSASPRGGAVPDAAALAEYAAAQLSHKW
ncbi:hypothetical protein RCAP_rcc02950 [Rhodobacter capsulatus SB 1003]|uniref:Uncharacterized protein n=1 Tax=Rhodobacter capsulatus (strain ATCC BAA-309 / NBRC 16581 / SB1003) TaxID=272942 RepID=D5APV8_RHOCB|nr:hypothetical protein RCAP_rcc02950 [Rhodobacter capsulatus SB 1003]